jgi:hypothetical protein
VSAPVLWWVSWEEHESPGDTRPIHDPPNPAVLAWWCTGYGGDEPGYATMVALVNAPNAAAIAKAIKVDWPTKKARVWRFKNERNERPLVIGDRFPFAPWSIERLKKLGVAHDVTPRKERS